MNGLEEKLRNVLESYDTDVLMYNKKLQDYRLKYTVYKEQKLEEECRILQLKINEIDLLVYSFTKLHREVTESLDKWQS